MRLVVTLIPDPHDRLMPDGSPRCHTISPKMLGLHLTGSPTTVAGLIPIAATHLANHNSLKLQTFDVRVRPVSFRRRFFMGLRNRITGIAHKDWVSEKWHDRLEFVAYRLVDPLIWV